MRAIAATDEAVPRSTANDVPVGSSLSSLWNALESAQWSLRAQQRWLPEALARARELAPSTRIEWLIRLREASQQAWAAPLCLRETLVELAGAWRDWPLLLMLCERMEAAGELPAWAGPLVATAHLRLGEPQVALTRCRAMALLDRQHRWATETHDALLRWIAFVDRTANAIVGETLRLEPLGHHHLEDFAQQYFDPTIAERCCLPTFADDAHWHRWLDRCWSFGDERLYAVIHPDWGFVGSVSLILRENIGFFYYWLGRDFQGHGIGPAAANLLLEDARRCCGMRACYAKVFEDNAPSRRALEKLGFGALDFRPSPPNGDEMFYRLGPAQSRQCIVEELRTLFKRMGCGTGVAVPLSASTV